MSLKRDINTIKSWIILAINQIAQYLHVNNPLAIELKNGIIDYKLDIPESHTVLKR